MGVEMTPMERKLDVGGTLTKIFQTYGDQAGVLLPVAFGLYLLVGIVSALLAGSLILLPLTLAVTVVAATLYQGMVVGLVKDVQDGRRDYSVGELIEATWPVVLPLIGAGLLAGLGIGFGFLLLVVPGLFLLTIWAVIAPAIVVEHCGVIEAFGRSRELVRGNGWQVFGVLFVVFVIAGVVSAILGAIGVAIVSGVGGRILGNVIAQTLTAPIGALAAATIYFALVPSDGGPEAPPAAPGPPPPDQPAIPG